MTIMTMDNWQAEAYVSLAMRRQGFSNDQIRKVIREMNWLFSEFTPEEIEAEAEALKELES